MTIALVALYALILFIGILNLLLMRKPSGSASEPAIAVLIPARNEAENLPFVLEPLQQDGTKVYVFDDESTDGTAEVARKYGAIVLSPSEPLPYDWTGKNRGCHALALAASEDFHGEWVLFLDADTRPTQQLMPALRQLLATDKGKTKVYSGMPTLLPAPGSLLENIYLLWVPWILGGTNPFGLVARTRRGHNRFLNGQFVLWNLRTYMELMPHEALKGVILEDVKIGRLLAKNRIHVEILNLSNILKVLMYRNFREAYAGMSKNSYEITGSTAGTLFLSAFFVWLALGWVPAALASNWVPLALFLFGGVVTAISVRRNPLLGLGAPLFVFLAGATMVNSLLWHRRGAVKWKDRTYKI